MIFLPWADQLWNWLLSDDPAPCWRCGELTFLIDLSFEAHLCADCIPEAWQEYDFASLGMEGWTLAALGCQSVGVWGEAPDFDA